MQWEGFVWWCMEWEDFGWCWSGLYDGVIQLEYRNAPENTSSKLPKWTTPKRSTSCSHNSNKPDLGVKLTRVEYRSPSVSTPSVLFWFLISYCILIFFFALVLLFADHLTPCLPCLNFCFMFWNLFVFFIKSWTCIYRQTVSDKHVCELSASMAFEGVLLMHCSVLMSGDAACFSLSLIEVQPSNEVESSCFPYCEKWK